MSHDTLLRVRDLTIGFPSEDGGWHRPVEGVTLTVGTGERIGLVGESGSGKSLTALACLGLVPEPGKILGGEVAIDGLDLVGAAARPAAAAIRGVAGLVFQEAESALNPVYTVGFQLEETIRVTRGVGRGEARQGVLDLLASVSLDEPESVRKAYPFELSGGQAQRVMLALALAGGPKLLIADEPTSSLDVVTQAQVLRLIKRLARERGLALLLISHDLAVVAGMVERAAVMHAGRIVEEGPSQALFSDPLHPFTRLLVASRPDRPKAQVQKSPPPRSRPKGGSCSFADRCSHVRPSCRARVPELEDAGVGRKVRCPVILGEMAAADGN